MDVTGTNLDGKHLLITSASNKLGRRIILNAIKQNAQVTFTDTAEKSSQAKAILAEANTLGLLPKLKFVSGDIATEEGVEKLIDTVMLDSDKLDSIIINLENNFEKTLPPLHELSLLQWETAFNNNLRPIFFLTRRLIEELLIQGNGGKLIPIALPELHIHNHAVYQSMQTALYSYARSITKEYGRRNILCNFITSNSSNETEKTDAYHASVAELALYLLSDAASFITGELFVAETLII